MISLHSLLPHGGRCVLTNNRTRTGRSQKIAPGLGAHKRSHPDLKHLTKLEMSSPDLNGVRVQHLTKLEMSSPDLNGVRVQHLTKLEMSSPDLSEVRVQHLTKLEMSSPDLNEVRVQRLRPVESVNANPNVVRVGTHKKIVPGLGAHKRSHPDLKHLTKLEMSSPDLNEVRVQGHKR